MKAIFTFTIIVVLMIVAAQEASAQGVAINENGAAPDPSAMLDVQSTEKGVLVPRMSQAQRDAIPSPATGLLIYQTDNEPGFYFNAGTPGSPFWQGISGSEGGSGQWNNNANMIYYDQGNVGIGFNAPPARITAIGNFGNPSIPGFASSGIARFGIIPQEAIDIGKKIAPPHTGWIQAGFNGDIADPLALNPVGGNIGIGTSNPIALLHAVGNDTGQGNVLFEGSFKSSNPGSPPKEGPGTRMMWYPDKAAFRAGQVTGDQWENQNIGNRSVGFGFNTTASGSSSTAIGYATTASGSSSTAIGYFSDASGYSSTAIGYSAKSSGFASTAIGHDTQALGNWSTAMGRLTIAYSTYETAIGVRNTEYSPLDPNDWHPNDRLFVIGNGEGYGANARSDALVVLKNGNIGIGNSFPLNRLHIRLSDNDDFVVVDRGSTGFGPIMEWYGFGQTHRLRLEYIENAVYNFETNQANRHIAFNPTGNFGIGTTNPSAKLHTTGSVRFEGLSGSGIRMLVANADGTVATHKHRYEIGDFAHGGVVFFVSECGTRGLVCDIMDRSTGVRWHAGEHNYTLALSDGPFSGQANTILIISRQGIGDGETYAARVANENLILGDISYGDWYLPSRIELLLMYEHRHIINATAIANGGMAFDSLGRYWSSTEDIGWDGLWAWAVDFSNGEMQRWAKLNTHPRVRPVRAF